MNTTEFRVSIERRIAAAETELAALRSTLAFEVHKADEAPRPRFFHKDSEGDRTEVVRADASPVPSALIEINGTCAYVPHDRIPDLVRTLAELYVSDVPTDDAVIPGDSLFERGGVGVASNSAPEDWDGNDAFINTSPGGNYVTPADIPAMLHALLTALRVPTE